jgi:hypothetical protein
MIDHFTYDLTTDEIAQLEDIQRCAAIGRQRVPTELQNGEYDRTNEKHEITACCYFGAAMIGKTGKIDDREVFEVMPIRVWPVLLANHTTIFVPVFQRNDRSGHDAAAALMAKIIAKAKATAVKKAAGS